jgi:hypothetical protein
MSLDDGVFAWAATASDDGFFKSGLLGYFRDGGFSGRWLGGDAFEFDDVVEGDKEISRTDESVLVSKIHVLWAVEGGGDARGVCGVEDSTEEDSALQREHLVAFGRMTGKRASMNSSPMIWVFL